MDTTAKTIMISMTKAELEAAPDFKTKAEREAEEQAAAQQQQLQQQQQQPLTAPPPQPTRGSPERNCTGSLGLVSCGVLALGALNRDLPEPLPRFFSDGAPRIHLAWMVHMGDILLWAAVGAIFVVAALAILAA